MRNYQIGVVASNAMKVLRRCDYLFDWRK